MSKIKFDFAKWQGCGNDFVMVDGFAATISEKHYSAIAKKVCDRHYGIGADGLIFLLPSDKADICMRIINADGSEAEMCGNGIRCLAAWAKKQGRVSTDEFTVETGAGVLVPNLIASGDRAGQVMVDMGEPILEGEKIPVLGFGMDKVVSKPVEAGDEKFAATCVSMGNPHCVIFVDNAEDFPVAKYGPILEKYEMFPSKTNVEFVNVLDENHVRMRVWERGAAVTMACGTGACATLVSCALNGYTGRRAEVKLDGGSLLVEWAEDNHVFMTGPAEEVFTGVCEVDV